MPTMGYCARTSVRPPGGRVVPILLPGLGETVITMRTAIGNLCPPRVFMDRYNVFMSARMATFVPKQLRRNMSLWSCH
jgi:hypothetical protein